MNQEQKNQEQKDQENSGPVESVQDQGTERKIIRGTFPPDIFAEEEERERLLTNHASFPDIKMTIIVVIILALIYLFFR